MCFGNKVSYVTHNHIQSQTVKMMKNNSVTDWRHLFSVFIWQGLAIWTHPKSTSISLAVYSKYSVE